MKTFHNFTATSIGGKPVPLSSYKGRVALVVNTASNCGFTSQYADLQSIYEKYQAQDFVVLGFPSNDFGAQEPGTNKEIEEFCDLHFKVKFPLFAKIVVRGEKKDPLYNFLVSTSPKDPNSEVKWNFEKFLVGKDGRVLDRFYSKSKPSDAEVVAAIEKALK